jgi:hypothetical protein
MWIKQFYPPPQTNKDDLKYDLAISELLKNLNDIYEGLFLLNFISVI